jgi:DeoR/GlpR family transcriptional regulator of sugar metabolism
MTKDKDPTPAPVFAAERQERIAALVTSRGRIHLDELASVFEVSQPTLRKDLTILERQGKEPDQKTHAPEQRQSKSCRDMNAAKKQD